MIFFNIYKMSNEATYYQINRGAIVNTAKYIMKITKKKH